MGMFTANDKTYEVDDKGFLVNAAHWTEGFAEGMASHLKIAGPLTTEHWNIIRYIRGTYDETGVCPTVYDTCRMNGLRLKDLRNLFPTGYVRGACLLSGITYRESHHGYAYQLDAAEDLNTISVSKTYETDVRGFLVHSDEWDEYFAAFRAHDMKIPGGRLTERHWQVIRYLRKIHETEQRIPTVYETCDANGIELDDLEKLFPDGYHRGAVKIAGLRLR